MTAPAWKFFTWHEIREAEAWARAGGIAIHSADDGHLIYTPPGRTEPTPCAHMFGPDRVTLTEQAGTLGQKANWIQYPNNPAKMHFDLWGVPLARAKARCKREEAARQAAATPTLFTGATDA